MVFSRTDSGIINQPIFFGCDTVVYVEGSAFFASHADTGEPCSLDSLFWSVILKSVLPEKVFHYKPLGARAVLLEFSSQLGADVSGRVLVAIDRDLDGLAPGTSYGPYVVCTHAYSWESDVWSLAIVLGLLNDFVHAATIPAGVQSELEMAWESFFNSVRKFTTLDAKLFFAGAPIIFFDRSKPSGLIKIEKDVVPTINQDACHSRLRVIRAQTGKPLTLGKLGQVDVFLHTFGKVIRDYGCHLIRHGAKRCGLSPIVSNDYLWALGLRKFGESLGQVSFGAIRDAYRANIFSALGIT